MDYLLQATAGIAKLNATNYEEWAFDIRLVCGLNMCSNILRGIEGEPEKSSIAEWFSWSQRKEIARSTILLAMDEDMQKKYIDYEEPRALWEKIKEDYATKIQKSSYEIREELSSTRLEDLGSVEAYARSIQHAVNQFNLAAKEDSEKMSKREHSFYLLHGIDPYSADWYITVQLIEGRIESESLDRKPDEILRMLLAREAEIRSVKGIAPDALLYPKASNESRMQSRNKRKKSLKCAYCGRRGHIDSNCFRKQREEPPGKRTTDN